MKSVARAARAPVERLVRARYFCSPLCVKRMKMIHILEFTLFVEIDSRLQSLRFGCVGCLRRYVMNIFCEL